MDILNAYVSTAYQVDNIWNVFMLVHVGLFGLLFKYREDRDLNIFYKIVVLVGYFVFAFMNMRSLITRYMLLDHIRLDIIDLSVHRHSKLA